MADPHDKQTLKLKMSRADLACFLRGMAEELESGHLTALQHDLQLDGLIDLKEVLKSDPLGVSLRINLSFRGFAADAAEAPPAAPSKAPDADRESEQAFAKIKKSLQLGLKTIKAAAAGGALPPDDLVESWCAQARRITGFSGKGEPHYPVWLKAVAQLEQASTAGDLPGLVRALEGIAGQKKACHKEFR